MIGMRRGFADSADRRPADRGAALVLALLALAWLTAIGVSLVWLGDTDRRIAASYEAATETFFAADAVVDWTLQELRAIPDWSDAVSGRVRSSLADSTNRPRTPSFGAIDLDAISAQIQAQSNVSWPAGANTPVWHLFGWGPLASLVRANPLDVPAYVAVWIADDPADADGNPSADWNGVVLIHAEAFGSAASRRVVEASAVQVLLATGARYRPASLEPTGTSGPAGSQAPPGDPQNVSGGSGPVGVKLLYWREVRRWPCGSFLRSCWRFWRGGPRRRPRSLTRAGARPYAGSCRRERPGP